MYNNTSINISLRLLVESWSSNFKSSDERKELVVHTYIHTYKEEESNELFKDGDELGYDSFSDDA